MEENEKKEEQIIENQEDEIYVKERDTSFRSKRKPTPNYEYNPNPMDPNKDGKNGKMYKFGQYLTKIHYKKNGVWHWSDWGVGSKEAMYHKYYFSNDIHVGNVKIKFKIQ